MSRFGEIAGTKLDRIRRAHSRIPHREVKGKKKFVVSESIQESRDLLFGKRKNGDQPDDGGQFCSRVMRDPRLIVSILEKFLQPFALDLHGTAGDEAGGEIFEVDDSFFGRELFEGRRVVAFRVAFGVTIEKVMEAFEGRSRQTPVRFFHEI